MKDHVIVFNKVSKEYFAVVSINALDEVDKKFFITKIVRFDDTTHEWDGGNFDNGQLVSIGVIGATMTESTLDADCGRSITDVYQTHHELNAIFIHILDAVSMHILDVHSAYIRCCIHANILDAAFMHILDAAFMHILDAVFMHI